MVQEISLDVLNQKSEGSTSREKHSWVVKIDEELNKLENIPETKPTNKKSSIYRRPVNVGERQDTSFLYTPRIVSFGPYHHDFLDEMKETVLVHWLKRSRKKLDDFLDDLTKVVEDLKDAYDQLDPKWQHDDDAFLQLMIYDGCFLLEILREAYHLGYCSRQICAMYGISPNELMEYYKRDMLLLENQLPTMLLLKLVAVQNDSSIQEAQKYLYELMLRFIPPSSANIAEELLRQEPERMYLHLLDLYRYSLLYKDNSGNSPCTIVKILNPLRWPLGTLFIWMILCVSILVLFYLPILAIMAIVYCPIQFLKYFFGTKPPTDIHFIIPSATELDKVGIGFKMNSTKSLLTITFVSGTLRVPQICVDGATQSRFLNIIAFEQLHEDADKHVVTSYIYFMSRLLQAAGDVRLLQVRCIIRTMLHNDEVVELFKSLSKDIIAHDPNIFLVEAYRNVGKGLTESFYIKMNNSWKRDLWQTYLKSPWTVISVVAAFFLFTLTAIQTVYAVLSYHNPK